MKYTRFFVFALIAALVTAVLPFPERQAQATENPSGFNFGLTKQCVRSPFPGQTNYYEDLSGCGSDTSHSFAVANQAEFGGDNGNSQGTGPASQSFAINQAGSPLGLSWSDIGNGRKSVRLETKYNDSTNSIAAGIYTWYVFMDHTDLRGGPFPRPDKLQTKVTVNYNPKLTAGAARAIIGWQGVWNNTAHNIEIAFNTTDNLGDNFPNDPEIIDMFPYPAGTNGKFLSVDGRYLNIPGVPAQLTAQAGSQTTLVVPWNKIVQHFIDRGLLPALPNNSYDGSYTQTVYLGTEVRNDVPKNAGNVALTISNFENSEIIDNTPPPAPAVLFSPAGGNFSGPTRVTFNRSKSSANIYYTTDGSNPTTASTRLIGSSLTVTRSLTLKAIEVIGKSSSVAYSGDFTIQRGKTDPGKNTVGDSGVYEDSTTDTGTAPTSDGKSAATNTNNASNNSTNSTNTTTGFPLFFTPVVNETWQVGQTKQIQWNAGNGIPATVKLELYQNDSCIPKTSSDNCTNIAIQKVLVADKLPNNGSYSWTIPTTIPSLLLNKPVILVLTSSPDGAYLGQSARFTVSNSSTTPPNPTGITITQTGTAAGEAGKPMAIGFKASPQANYMWSVDGVMPSGLTLSEPPLPAATTNRACSPNDCPVYYKNTAIISGAPKAAGTYNITVLAKNEAGVVGKLPVTIVVTKAVSSGTTTADYAPGINFKYRGNPTVYYLDTDRTKMAYPSFAFLRAWGVQTSDIVIMPDDVQFPDSPNPMPLPNGTLIKVDGDQTVYQLDRGKLRAFTSSRAFTDRGNQFSNIYPINPGDRARLQYDTGDVIQ